jgi:hypothetical protein
VDPLYRRETLVAMDRELNRRFPSLGLGGENPDEAAATLGGVHGALAVSVIFGIPVEQYSGNWPAARHELLGDQPL